jgi:hypothetical protein
VSLALTLALIGFRITLYESVFTVARSAFDAGIALVLFAIADLDHRRPGEALKFLSFSYRGVPEVYSTITSSALKALEIKRWPEIVLLTSVILIWVLSRFISA